MSSSLPPAVLVTGSSRGLGRGIALELAASGYSVAIHYANNATAARETAEECSKLATVDGQIFPIVGGNVGNSEARKVLMQNTIDAFGGRLDALINNAGIAPRVRADITEATEEIWDEVLEVNLKGPYFLSQAAVKHWLANPGKSALATGYKLIFVTSLSANTASVNRGEYCISKAGLAMANQLWAVRLAAEGIQVLELRPGIMATDMTSGVKGKYDQLIEDGLVPQKRWGTPADLGYAVKAVLAGAFPFSTGDAINVDGGFHLRRL
ncbi:3-ketoacyl-ACP reductase [Verrucomicrobia bacterium LW23]|nr:3-ketoacyl-ACP reductase [Verrucomicrobia bacterium LW23]